LPHLTACKARLALAGAEYGDGRDSLENVTKDLALSKRLDPHKTVYARASDLLLFRRAREMKKNRNVVALRRDATRQRSDQMQNAPPSKR
jgi:hypothetical protein